MANNTFIDVKFAEAKRCSTELMNDIIKMRNILDALEEKVSIMRWEGANATEFKQKIEKIKPELDNIYNSYVSKIPEAIDISMANYQNNEQ